MQRRILTPKMARDLGAQKAASRQSDSQKEAKKTENPAPITSELLKYLIDTYNYDTGKRLVCSYPDEPYPDMVQKWVPDNGGWQLVVPPEHVIRTSDNTCDNSGYTCSMNGYDLTAYLAGAISFGVLAS